MILKRKAIIYVKGEVELRWHDINAYEITWIAMMTNEVEFKAALQKIIKILLIKGNDKGYQSGTKMELDKIK